MNRYEMQEKLVEALGESGTLDALVQAMSTQEMTENFDFICRMNDIEIGE